MTDQIILTDLHKEIVTLTDLWFKKQQLGQSLYRINDSTLIYSDTDSIIPLSIYDKIKQASEEFPEIHKLLEFFKQFGNPLKYFSISVCPKDQDKEIHLFTIRARDHKHAQCMFNQLYSILQKHKNDNFAIEEGLINLKPQIEWKTPKIERIF